ncbi:MAG: hypothetical protein M3N82_13220 [Pseudomonadota bacterium]|nr:hypothetical protein [Pseudomonadota bacterium]
MTKVHLGLAVSWLALFVGLAAVVVSTMPGGGQLMGWFMFDHGLVLLNLFLASWFLRRPRPGAPPFRWPGARSLFAPWLIVTGCLAASVLIGLHALLPLDLLLPSGHHLRLVALAAGSASFPAGHGQSNDQAFAVFAQGWVVFSFAGLCMWHMVSLRGAHRQESGSDATPGRPVDDGVDPDGRLAFRGRVLIGAIWVIALAWSALSFDQFMDHRMCGAPFPWPVALVPPIFFSVSALFAKRAQYMSPWLTELVDSRFGAGAYARFLVGLKPMLLLAVCGLVGALAALRACGEQGDGPPFVSVFFASASLGFALAHSIMRVRKIEGV